MTTTTGQTGLAEALTRLSQLVAHVFADVSRSRDLTPQQAQLLCTLLEGPIGMTELGRLLHLEKSSLTGLVDRVERRGLVVRTRDPNDRRASQVALTGQGARLAADSHEDVTERLEALADELAPADRKRLASAIATMLDRSVA
jgi:DNA-binding MarR family transcriptional regulator